MEKTEFVYQRWFLRIACSWLVLPLVFVLQHFLFRLFHIEQINFWFFVICIAVSFSGMSIYFKYTDRRKWFERTGSYWVEDGTVFIQKHNKLYRIQNANWLQGTTVSAYGLAKSGMLVVRFEGVKVVLVSSLNTRQDAFSDSDLLDLFETILENNPNLIKDDKLDFWYESKQKK